MAASDTADSDPATAAQQGADAVVADDLLVTYGQHVAVRDATFALPRGRVTAVIGPNGSGKTTLLRTMSGLERLRRGRLDVLGVPAGSDRRRVAHVMQSNVVNETLPLTVREVVTMGRYAPRGMLGRLTAEDRSAVTAAMERMGIADLARRQLRKLSGGQRQRVFVAQGLAQGAELLLLDEPITGLDLTSQRWIDQAIDAERAAGRTTVLTTHDVAVAAAADHVLLLATHIVAGGPPDHVLSEEHLSHAYGGRAYRTADGTLVIGDPHIHGVRLTGHEGSPPTTS